VTRLILEKLLLTPTEQLKSLGDPETVGVYTEALSRLFKLGPSTSGDVAEEEKTVDPSSDDETPSAGGGRIEPFPQSSVRGGRRSR
jgi:hypothetical protein